MVVGGKGVQGQVVVVVRCEGAGDGHCRVVVLGWSLSLLWVREWRWWVMEQGGQKYARGYRESIPNIDENMLSPSETNVYCT
jgi:hypothetical protein